MWSCGDVAMCRCGCVDVDVWRCVDEMSRCGDV